MAKITIKDIERFTEGDCHLLARAISLKTGWPVYAFWQGCGYGYDLHAFVKMPNGKYLDVEGVKTERQLQKEYGHPTIKEVDWPVLADDWGVAPMFGPYSLRRATVVADVLIQTALEVL